MNGKYRSLVKVSTVLILVTIMMLNVVLLCMKTSAQEVPKGPWVDEVIFSLESDTAKVIDMLKKNEIQAYFTDIDDPELFKVIKESPELKYVVSYGLYFELTLNPAGPEFKTGELNPFAVPRIREALNYLFDREYIANEIMGGLAVPKYTCLTPNFPDYTRYADEIMRLKEAYSYDFEKAKAIITEEMQKLGAELVDGKWYYKGKPVVLKFLIRTEDKRREIGDYIASQLEKVGFTVERLYKTSKEAAPIWIASDPADGLWHMYTGGWITTAVVRDESDNFDFFYTPRGLPFPLWQAYKPEPEFDHIAKRLAMRDFKDLDEREELMKKALWLAMKDSARVWLVHNISPWVYRKELSIAYDLAGGLSGCRLWPYTIRYEGKVGGTVKIASASLLVDPWNPLGGSDWIYDQMIIRATSDPPVIQDPYTGLYRPNRVKKAEVYVLEGLPVVKSLDWVSLEFVDKIEVPTDAWIGWNATAKKIITAPPGTTAKAKVVVYFEDDLFKKVKWHDGSPMTIADIIFSFILTFDRADPNSPVYDEAHAIDIAPFLETFKGFRIVSEDPLVIEYYTDAWYLDAELIAADAALAFWPEATYGPTPWHTVAIGWLAEFEKKLAFSSDKAEALGVEWMNYIAGPSLEVFKEMLDKAIETTFIPYKEVLGEYITEEEAKTRYENLKKWFEEKGHFWVGNGPFYLESVDTTAKVVIIKAFREYPDPADKWAGLGEPKIPEVEVSGSSTVVQVLPARFKVTVTYQGEPYKVSDIQFVKYVIKHPGGYTVGMAKPVRDGEFEIALSAGETSLLLTGTSEMTVFVSSKLVALPVSAKYTFTVLSFEEYLGSELAKLKAEYTAAISSLQNRISSLESDLAKLNETVSSLEATLRTTMTLAIVGIVLALVSIALAFLLRKSGKS